MATFKTEAERDRERAIYYMTIAAAVRHRANCWGSEVGAVLVRGDRVISTGYNGTPSGSQNCREGGCLRCQERYLEKKDEGYKSPHEEVLLGKALDICLCVHAEQNALLSAARHGIEVAESRMYVTHQPCFSCLKESLQAGVTQVIYLLEWFGAKDEQLKQQYMQLTDQLEASPAFAGFEQLDHDTFREFKFAVAPLFEESADRSPEMGSGG